MCVCEKDHFIIIDEYGKANVCQITRGKSYNHYEP